MDKAEGAARLTWRHFALLVLVPVIANAGILSGFSHCDPEFIYSGLSTGLRLGFLPGAACFVDPAVAYITQPLGHLSAEDWLHGIIPWWNPYNGVGMPLAAEMQNESFFLPFVLLLHFHNGWLLQRLVFQILSAVFSCLFLRTLRLGGRAAVFGGLLYGLSGTFILTAGAPGGPVFCLPLLLLGIEQAWQAAQQGQRLGWTLIMLALALSIYAGFVEISYFNGLLAGVWALLRLAQLERDHRRAFMAKLAAGLAAGLGLSAPLWVSFVQYLRLADIGAHAHYFVLHGLPAAAAPLQIFPLIYGALAMPQPASLQPFMQNIWVQIGGWFGCAPVLLALYALTAPRPRMFARDLMACWILLWEARYFNFPGVRFLLNLVPGLAATDMDRFSMVSVEFALFMLSACGIDDLARNQANAHKRFLVVAVLFVALALLALVPAMPAFTAWYALFAGLRTLGAAYMAASLMLGAFCLYAIYTRKYLRFLEPAIIAGAVMVFLMPQLSAPRGGAVAVGGLEKLSASLGNARFYTIGPLEPNFNAAYGLASINYSQLPVPLNWANHISQILFSGANVIDFQGNQPDQLFYFMTNMQAYEALGVKYLLTPPGLNLNGWQPEPVDIAAPGGPIWINGQSEIQFSVEVPVAAPVNVARIRINFMNDFGVATGVLHVRACAGDQCAQGAADISHVLNYANIDLPLDHSLQISGSTRMDFIFTHPSGGELAIWLSGAKPNSGQIIPPTFLADANGGILDFARDQNNKGLINYRHTMLVPAGFVPAPMAPIFQGRVMDIYKLPHPVPLASATGNDCSVQELSWHHFRADCAHADTLVWRELFYPGWHAMVNGKPVAVSRQGDIFQAVPIAAGVNDVWFYYQPPYGVPALAAAVLAMIFWLLCLLRANQMRLVA